MDLYFDTKLAMNYKSNSQKIRVMSENWMGKNIFCPICGNPHIRNLDNNMPVADLRCDNCGEIFELKSKQGKLSTKISDGAYSTMIQRINSSSNPNLFILNYSNNYQVTDLLIIPKFFFTENIIEKRKPLAPTAKRAGWIGCNIVFGNVPSQGIIKIIDNQNIYDIADVVKKYDQIKNLQINNLEKRGWILDVLNCVNSINENTFSLKDIYCFKEQLQNKHENNHNVEAKIRQQLQVLRDKGFIEFLGNGQYRKIL